MSIDYQRLLQGRYEAERLPRDFSAERFVPDFAFNILNKAGLLYRPVVDEQYLEKGRIPHWPEGKPFAVCLTYDVDRVTEKDLGQAVRTRRLQYSTAGSMKDKAKEILKLGIDLADHVLCCGRPDSLWCLERFLEVEEQLSARSTLFFWPGLSAVGKRHYTDCVYELSDSVVFDHQRCTVAEMVQEIHRRGWEIGLHPSWYSFDNTDELKRQKEVLETALGHEILSVRQHYLHYDIRRTPSVQAAAGFVFDSTLGFNDNVGFRFGSCYPWHLYDIEAQQELPIMEIPLIIQDGAMLSPFKGMRLDEDAAFEYVVLLTERVKYVGGVLTILWHPHLILLEDYWEFYWKTLNYLSEQDAWMTSIREVGQGWMNKENSDTRITDSDVR